MDIRSLLMKDIMIMDLKATTKSEVIDEMVHNYYEHGIIDDEDLYKKDIIKREEEGSTGMGDGMLSHTHMTLQLRNQLYNLLEVLQVLTMTQWTANQLTYSS